MSEQTYTHRTASGMEVELKRMKSYHQEWLTQGKSGNQSTVKKTNKSQKNIDNVAADIIVRIDDDTDITLQKISKLPSWEFKEIMLVARFFSCDIYFTDRVNEYEQYLKTKELIFLAIDYKNGKISKEEILSKEIEIIELEQYMELEEVPEFESNLPEHLFKFTWEWRNGDEQHKHKFEVPINIWDFPVEKSKVVYDWTALQKGDCCKKQITLPISKKLIQWSMLNVDLENKFKGSLNMETLHINTPITWRNPVELVKKESSEGYIPVQLNTSKMEILDIEALREDISNNEGKIDTILTLNHPEKDELIRVDIFQVVSFFIPSGVV
jgi:hypothetical protein